MHKLLPKFAISILSAAVLAGCAVGPDYQAPEQVGDISVAVPYQPADITNWWLGFDDADLNRLINTALQHNRTLVQAQANVKRAYAVFQDADNNLLPQGNVQAGYQAGKNMTLAANDDNVTSRGYLTGASLSWDLDLFGKLRRAAEAAQAQAQQADILWHDARLQLISQVASSYGDYRGAQLRLVVANQNLQNLTQSRDIIMARLDAGMASDLELAQLDAQVFEVQSAIPAFELALATAEATLSALLAQQPGQLKLGAVPKLPVLTQPVPLHSGSQYLRYRADVAAAERELAASTANIGVATADLYPNLSVSGFLGFLSAPGLALNSDTQSWSVAPTLSWQLADMGSVKARIRASEAGATIALAQFEQQVFDALAEMQLALQSYNFSRQQQLLVQQQWQASNKALKIARDRYNAGSGEFLQLLDAERELLRSRDQLAQLEQQSFLRLVSIYRNFGGGLQVI